MCYNQGLKLIFYTDFEYLLKPLKNEIYTETGKKSIKTNSVNQYRNQNQKNSKLLFKNKNEIRKNKYQYLKPKSKSEKNKYRYPKSK